MTKVNSQDLSESAQSLRGAVQGDQFRICSAGKKSFLEAASPALRVRKTFEMKGSSWDVLLPFTAFEKIVRLFRGEIELEAEEGKLIFRDGRRELQLEAQDASDWVSSPDWTEPLEIASVAADDFRRLLRQAIRAVSQDAGRPLLQTVAIAETKKGASFVATDSFRLLELPLPVEQKASMPASLLLERAAAKSLVADLQRTKPEDVWIEFARQGESSGGILSYGTTSWYFRSPDGAYPEWQDLLDASGPDLRLDREDILGLLAFVEAMQGRARVEQNGATALRLQLGPKVQARFQRPGLGEIEENLRNSSWSGPEEMIGINPLFVRDMIDVLEGETLRGQRAASGGFVFRGRGDARYLLMPIRLPEDM